MNYIIREAMLDDLDDIVRLWRRLSRGQMSKDPFYKGDLEFAGGYHQMEESIKSQESGVFIAKYDGKIQGFIEVWSELRGFQIERQDCGYIVHCILDNQSRKIGSSYYVARRLYAAAEKWAIEKGKKYITADVFEKNKTVVYMLQKEHLVNYKIRMVRKI